MPSAIVIEGENLTFEQVLAVAYGKLGEPCVELSESAKQRVDRCAEAVQTLLDRGNLRIRLHRAYYELAAAQAKAARELSDSADALGRVTRSAAPYFLNLPRQEIATTKTDADGNFSLSVERGTSNLAIVASTTRFVGVGDEAYFWAIKMPRGSSTKISPTNDNLCSSDSATSLLHTLDLDAAATQALALSPEIIETRMNKLLALISPSPSPAPLKTESSVALASPIPESSPLPPPPPPEFIKLTKQFTLISSKGKEVKILPSGKRLRLISRDQSSVTIDHFGDSFVIPSEITEPSK